MKRILQLCLAGVLALGATGAAAALTPDDSVAQQRITREVRHKLVMLPYFSIFDNLAYKVDGDTVTLYGQVRNAFLKDAAQSAVKHIEGVDHINNQIEVLPASFNDDRIRRETARAIFRNSSLSRYSIQPVPSIHIIVKNGHVALEGVVGSEFDKNMAYIRANGVPGVFSVENNLRIEK
ncbi:MAG TPA: BON domain-containing protein [Candidatus Angelobacter sp.]|nr:BON domain-containing protein [Candidatus Angelobacter sp.]